jgi:hypothetical protein
MSTVVAPDVAEGIDQLEEAFPGQVFHEPDGSGGAYITIEDLELGSGWNVSAASISFHLPYNYPAAAPYPFYLPGDTSPHGAWPQVLQQVSWRGRQVVQVSLRHNNWDPHRDTAVGSVMQVRNRLRDL